VSVTARVAQSLRTWSPANVAKAGGAVTTAGKINLGGYRRIVGQVVQDVATTVVIEFRSERSPTAPVVETYTIPQDASQVGVFAYTWDITIRADYVTITATNGGAPSTFFRAHNEAYPV
jgi:hypothetical protein